MMFKHIKHDICGCEVSFAVELPLYLKPSFKCVNDGLNFTIFVLYALYIISVHICLSICVLESTNYNIHITITSYNCNLVFWGRIMLYILEKDLYITACLQLIKNRISTFISFVSRVNSMSLNFGHDLDPEVSI